MSPEWPGCRDCRGQAGVEAEPWPCSPRERCGSARPVRSWRRVETAGFRWPRLVGESSRGTMRMTSAGEEREEMQSPEPAEGEVEEAVVPSSIRPGLLAQVGPRRP